MEKKKGKSILGKFLKISGYSIGVILILLFVTPFLFKGKIETLIQETANKNLNAILSFDDTSLSFFRDFPQANISLNNLVIANKAPFEGDTLFKAEKVSLSMSITELFKGKKEAKQLKSIATENGFVNIYFNKLGNGNYEITKTSKQTSKEETKTSNIKLDINSYEIKNMRFHYYDDASKIDFALDQINHTGTGNFAQSVLDLDTKTDAYISLAMDSINYLKNVHVDLDAIIGIDLDNFKFTFKDNIAHINKLPLKFNGFLQLVENGQQYLIDFSTPSSTFKNALGLLPEQYSGNLKDVETNGNFVLKGNVNGLYSEKTIPNFLMVLQANDAYFKYKNLPKSVKNINLDIALGNTTSNIKDTYFTIKKSTFSIDEDTFKLNGQVTHLLTNPKIQVNANGVINLQNVGKVYPATIKNELTGVLKANISTNFSMDAIEKQQYSRVKNEGAISLSNFTYNNEELPQKIDINNASLNFNTNTVSLNNFKAKAGISDIEMNGDLNNFYGFLFKDEVLKGNFNLSSNRFKVEDFMASSNKTTNNTTNETTSLAIPKFLDVTLNAKANTVNYSDITLTNVNGKLTIKNQTVALQDITSSIFGGKIGFNGTISTQETIPKFAMNLDLKRIGISESFAKLEMLNAIAPIANVVNGKLNTKIDVSGNLTDELLPNLESISGSLFGQLLETQVVEGKSKVLNLLDNKLNFIDVKSLNLNDIKGYFTFKNGKVNVKPIKITHKDIKMTIAGEHSFSNSMNYDVNFDIPVKYLGNSITTALKKLSPSDASSIKSIPVKANLTGSFSSPTFSSDLSSVTSNLMNSIVAKQKESLVNKGKEKLNNLINGNAKAKDSTNKKTSTEDKVKSTLKNLFGKKKGN